DPSKRIAYILELKGLLTEDESYQLPQDFLMEMMEVNEALMELEFDSDENTLHDIGRKVTAMEQAIQVELAACTAALSDANEAEQDDLYLKMKDIWYRQKYLLRIRESLNRFAAR
ncbi:MAG: Fe-S protein assembly co-chaperone HscB, partial [Bacteroidota bacterium]